MHKRHDMQRLLLCLRAARDFDDDNDDCDDYYNSADNHYDQADDYNHACRDDDYRQAVYDNDHCMRMEGRRMRRL